MAFRSIEAIVEPNNLHFVGDGFRVYGILGRKEPLTMKRMSPFLLMDYAPPHYFPPNNGAPRGVESYIKNITKKTLERKVVKCKWSSCGSISQLKIK